MSVPASTTPAPMSLEEMDWITIRTFYGTTNPSKVKPRISRDVGIPLSRVIKALHYGKNHDISINVVNAISSNKNHPVDGDPLNGLKFSATPNKRALEGLLFDTKYRRTREKTALAQYRAAQATEQDPVKARIYGKMALDAKARADALNAEISDIKFLISVS
jgi:hypothetical protein